MAPVSKIFKKVFIRAFSYMNYHTVISVELHVNGTSPKPTIIQKRFICMQLSFYLEKLLLMSPYHSKKITRMFLTFLDVNGKW